MHDYSKALWVALLVTVGFVALLTFPPDDGLRHVGLAFGPHRDWGSVYPHSVFALHGGYDPWWGYDHLLRLVARGLSALALPPLLAPFVLMKLLSLLFMVAFVALVIRRGRLAEASRDGRGFLLALGLVLLCLTNSLMRLSLARPFGFGTLFLLYTVGTRGWLRGLLSAAALTALYPYLAWIYTVPVALVGLWRGDRRFALGVAAATLGGALVQSGAFFSMQLALIRSDGLRSQFEIKIGEFTSFWTHLRFYGFFLGLALVLYPWLARREKVPAERWLLLLFLVPSVRYVRYLLDVALPLLVVSYGAEVVGLLREPLGRLAAAWKARLPRRGAPAQPEAQAQAQAQAETGAVPPAKGRSLWPVLTLLYVVAFGGASVIGLKEYVRLRHLAGDLAPVPRDALVLTEFDAQYELLLVRPDLRLVPSSELVFFAPAIRTEYLGFFNRGEVCPLARRIGATFFVERRGMYVDPQSASCLERVPSSAALNLWRVKRR